MNNRLFKTDLCPESFWPMVYQSLPPITVLWQQKPSANNDFRSIIGFYYCAVFFFQFLWPFIICLCGCSSYIFTWDSPFQWQVEFLRYGCMAIVKKQCRLFGYKTTCYLCSTMKANVARNSPWKLLELLEMTLPALLFLGV